MTDPQMEEPGHLPTMKEVNDAMDKSIRLQIASDKIAHLAESVQGLDRELCNLASEIGDDLMEKVYAAFPAAPDIGPDSVKRLCSLSRALEPHEAS